MIQMAGKTKQVKDLKPRKTAARKVKGGFGPPGVDPLRTVRERIQQIKPTTTTAN